MSIRLIFEQLNCQRFIFFINDSVPSALVNITNPLINVLDSDAKPYWVRDHKEGLNENGFFFGKNHNSCKTKLT